MFSKLMRRLKRWWGAQPRSRTWKPHRFRPEVEVLEGRVVPSTVIGDLNVVYTPTIVAGDPKGSYPDSPSYRVNSNTITSPFDGVVSVRVETTSGTWLGTGSLIYQDENNGAYILTAAHMVDINNDGQVTAADGISKVYVYFNVPDGSSADGSTAYAKIQVSEWTINPDYTGFNNPSVSDDLAILWINPTNENLIPNDVSVYTIWGGSIEDEIITLVGYGQSGYGTKGSYTIGASWTVKRVGYNVAEGFEWQDDAGGVGANEVFIFDFDGRTSSTNTLPYTYGGTSTLTLGNRLETTLGGGDSGGPSFIYVEGSGYFLAGINTFSMSLGGNWNAPRFGSQGGGIIVAPYIDWIQSVLAGHGGSATVIGSADAGTPPGVAANLSPKYLVSGFMGSAQAGQAFVQLNGTPLELGLGAGNATARGVNGFASAVPMTTPSGKVVLVPEVAANHPTSPNATFTATWSLVVGEAPESVPPVCPPALPSEHKLPDAVPEKVIDMLPGVLEELPLPTIFDCSEPVGDLPSVPTLIEIPVAPLQLGDDQPTTAMLAALAAVMTAGGLHPVTRANDTEERRRQ